MSMLVDFMSMSVDFRSMLVDFRAHPVDFWSGLAASVKSFALVITRDKRERYGKPARLASAIFDQKGAFWDRKTPENTVLACPQL